MRRKRMAAGAVVLSVALGASIWAGTAIGSKGSDRQADSGLIALGMVSRHNLDIWLVRPTGAKVKRLTTDAEADALPAWSPDGSRIAYIRRFQDDSETLNGEAGALGNAIDFGPLGHSRNSGGQLSVVNANGAGGRVLVRTMPAAAPAWSPDGTRIAFARPNKGIYVVGAEGAGLRRLTSGHDDYPAWSPDGTRIAYTTDAGLWVMNSDGSHRRSLTSGPVGDDLGPAWSPDGSLIAFTRFTDDGRAVRVVDSEGRSARRLAYSSGGVVDPNVSMDPVPVWSPDGTRLAFDVGNDNGTPSIGVVNRGGTGLRVYKHNHDGDFHPSWSPDGKSLVVTSWLAKGEGVGLLSLDSPGPPRIIVRGFNTTPAWSP